MRQLEALNSQIEFQSAHVTLIRYLASSDKSHTCKSMVAIRNEKLLLSISV